MQTAELATGLKSENLPLVMVDVRLGTVMPWATFERTEVF